MLVEEKLKQPAFFFRKICDSFNTLRAEIEKLKKDTSKEAENNETLTSLHVRIEDNIQNTSKLMAMENDKLDNLQSELVKLGKFSEQEQYEYDLINGVRMIILYTYIVNIYHVENCFYQAIRSSKYNINFIFQEWQCLLHEEEEVDKELARFLNKHNELENVIYSKLEEKVAHDKTARYLNKLLLDSKESTQEQELLSVEAENSYGKKLLELEQLNATIPQEKLELEELSLSNAAKGKEIDEIQKEIKRHEVAVERKQMKIVTLNKTIEEVIMTSRKL